MLFVSAFAQEFITIKGNVTDRENNKPLEYASVSIKGAPIGTVTNDEGNFVFHIPEKYMADSLLISILGYESYKEKVQNIKTKLNVKLKPVNFTLKEIKINPNLVQEIIKKAYKNIKQNYPQEPFILDGYYQQYIKEGDVFVRAIELATSMYAKKANEKIPAFAFKLNGIRCSEDRIRNYNSLVTNGLIVL